MEYISEYAFTLKEVTVIQVGLEVLIKLSKDDSKIQKQAKATYEKLALITGITIEKIEDIISSHQEKNN